MQPSLTAAQRAVIDSKLRDAHEFYRRTNDILGILGFSAGIACMGTENQPFYAIISAGFFLIVWTYQTYSFNRRLALLKEIGHPEARVFRVWFRAWPALVGCAFLFLVAGGFLDKFGVHFPPNTPYCLRSQPATGTHLAATCASIGKGS